MAIGGQASSIGITQKPDPFAMGLLKVRCNTKLGRHTRSSGARRRGQRFVARSLSKHRSGLLLMATQMANNVRIRLVNIIAAVK